MLSKVARGLSGILTLSLLAMFVLLSNARALQAQGLSGAPTAPLTAREGAELRALEQAVTSGRPLTPADKARLQALTARNGEAAPTGISPEAVSPYTFSQATSAYTPIVGGTVHGVATNDDTLFPAIAIGFTFTYNDTPYTQVGICSNGYIVMGLTSGTSCAVYTPISSTTYNNLVSALGRDLQGNTTTGELRSQTQGSAPNRTYTVQWKSYRKYAATGDDFNFQITLYETTNVVEVKYGAFTVNATSSTPQVGIKGGSNSDFNNRKTTTDWTASTAGTLNTDTMTLSTSVKPPSDLTFRWTPPVVATPPNCATSFSPANLATNVSGAAILSWASGGGAPTGYRISAGTDNPPTNIANNVDLGNVTTYDPPGNLAYSTIHYWKIVPYNAFGNATGCSILSFTTEADPTVITFPYTQNFDSATVPNLPSGWTRTNNNADAYQWETNTGAPRSAPNSMYIRYNTAAAMDDWFFSPPLQLTAGTPYEVRFWYRGNSTTFIEKLEVKWGTAPNAAGMTGGQIFNNSNINFLTYTEGVGTSITPGSSGIYYVGWHGYSAADQFNLYVDDVSIAALNNPPGCATSFSPANLATNVSGAAILSWANGGGGPTGYRISFGTDNPPTNIANNVDLGNVTTYDPPGNLAYSTVHYWKIVPYNAFGDATGCSILSFTTEADPTIGTFPYAVDFGAPSCVIPTGWANDPTNLENWLFAVPGNNSDPAQYGADADHTSGTGCIAWINDSTPDNANPALLVSPPLNLMALTTPKLSFWYQNIDGGSAGAVSVLNVDVYDGTTWHEDVLTVNTPLDDWTQFDLNLMAYKSAQTRVRFQANEQLGDFDSDPSLDDILVFDDITPDLGDSTKTVSDGFVPIGQDVTFTLVVQNTGGGSASNVVLVDPIPAGSTYVAGSVATIGGPPDATYNAGLNQIEWGTAAFAVGDVVTITYDATIVGPGAVVNSANLSASNAAPVTLQATVNTCLAVNSYPYAESFEAGAGGWSSGGLLNSWELGTPADTVINSAYDGVNAWKTKLNGDYNNSEQSYVLGPCFDFSSLADPVVELAVWWEAESGWDGAKLQASTDSGASWSTVGVFGDPNNWYNQSGVDGLAWTGNQHGWSGSTDTGNGSNGYLVARHSLTGLGGQADVLLRVAFGSDSSVVDEGIAFDLVQIHEALAVSKAVDDATPMSGQMLTYNVVMRNDGNGNITNGTLSDALPAELAFVPGSVVIAPASAGVAGTPPTLASSLTITGGTSVTVTFQATVMFGLPVGTVVNNTAEVSSPVYTTALTADAAVTVDSFSSETLPISGAGPYVFNAGVVTLEVTNDGGCLTGLQVDRTEMDHPSAPNSSLMTGRYWSFTPQGCTSGFMVNLTLPATFTPDSGALLCRWDGSGNLPEDWDCAASSFSAGDRTVTRTGVTQFSDWVVGKKSPLAISLRAMTTSSNPPVALVLTMVFTAGALVGLAWRRRR